MEGFNEEILQKFEEIYQTLLKKYPNPLKSQCKAMVIAEDCIEDITSKKGFHPINNKTQNENGYVIGTMENNGYYKNIPVIVSPEQEEGRLYFLYTDVPRLQLMKDELFNMTFNLSLAANPSVGIELGWIQQYIEEKESELEQPIHVEV